jgi:hypothetical protein
VSDCRGSWFVAWGVVMDWLLLRLLASPEEKSRGDIAEPMTRLRLRESRTVVA